MKSKRLTRRQILSASAGAAAATVAGTSPASAARGNTKDGAGPKGFTYCFNTATIRGQKLDLVRQIEVVAQAGYTGFEPWVRDVQKYAEDGGSLPDLKKRLSDLGLTVQSAIGFARWIVDDDEARAKGVEQLKGEMETLAAIGGKRIAAPPAGANREGGLDLLKAAERYRAILEMGDDVGVVPQLEIWGPSKNLHRLGEAAFVMIEAGHPKACMLPDVYHIYKGGSAHTGLNLFSANAIQVFHINDYPAEPPRATIGDRDRVMPGDGIAPMSQILRDMLAKGGETVLSLELFSPVYWEKDPLEVAKLGLEKMKECVAKAT